MPEVTARLRVVRSEGAGAGNSVMSVRDTPKGKSVSPSEPPTITESQHPTAQAGRPYRHIWVAHREFVSSLLSSIGQPAERWEKRHAANSSGA
jgi:hypothetical protein